jgi:hypothetical protein
MFDVMGILIRNDAPTGPESAGRLALAPALALLAGSAMWLFNGKHRGKR